MNPFDLKNLLKPWSRSSQFLSPPQGPRLVEVFWASALSILDSCLGMVEAEKALFFPLRRCQHLKVNNIQEGSRVREASGLSLSPQTKPVRAWIWPVWNAETRRATAAPGLDITSSSQTGTVMEKESFLLQLVIFRIQNPVRQTIQFRDSSS